MAIDQKGVPISLVVLDTVKAQSKVGIPSNGFKPSVILIYWPFQEGISDMVLCFAWFGISFCAIFMLYVSIDKVWVAKGPSFGKKLLIV